jgi:hypothetical protein
VRASAPALAAAIALVIASTATANGDPASQALPTSDVFVSERVAGGVRANLEELARRARERGHPVKVAVLTQPIELGNLIDLYEAPERYAFHLGTELKFFADFDGTLLVAMPTGFGTYGSEAGRVRVPPDPSLDPDTLARSAARAIRPLADPADDGGGLGLVWILALVGGGLALAVPVALLALRGRGSKEAAA